MIQFTHPIVLTAFGFQSHLDKRAIHDDLTEASLDAGGDTDLATDIEESYVSAGMKRKAEGSVSSASSAPKWVLIYLYRAFALIVYHQIETVTSHRSIRVVVNGPLRRHWAR